MSEFIKNYPIYSILISLGIGTKIFKQSRQFQNQLSDLNMTNTIFSHTNSETTKKKLKSLIIRKQLQINFIKTFSRIPITAAIFFPIIIHLENMRYNKNNKDIIN